ncbi:unnamed protein product [Peniophora sp. CBMAI 1063]|nr:unnamed protein product [Peniophora sp. CBMAI 1063]
MLVSLLISAGLDHPCCWAEPHDQYTHRCGWGHTMRSILSYIDGRNRPFNVRLLDNAQNSVEEINGAATGCPVQWTVS